MRQDYETLLPKKPEKRSWAPVVALLFLGAVIGSVLYTQGFMQANTETAIGISRDRLIALEEDRVEEPKAGDEEIAVGAAGLLEVAVGAKSADALCNTIKTKLGNPGVNGKFPNYKVDGIDVAGPRFGIEVEFHAAGINMDTQKHFMVKKQDNPMEGPGYEYGTILSITYYKKGTADERKLITWEAETQSRIEAATGIFNAQAPNHKLFTCTFSLIALMKNLLQPGKTLKSAFADLKAQGWATGTPCAEFGADLSQGPCAECAKAHKGGVVWTAVGSTASQINFGIPLSAYDPLLLGDVSSADNWKAQPGLKQKDAACNTECPTGEWCNKCGTGKCKANKCTDAINAKGYGVRLPTGIEDMFTLRTLRNDMFKDDVAKLQLIQHPDVRYVVTLWREVEMTLKKFSLIEPLDNRPKKRAFHLFPKYRFNPTTDLFKLCKEVYIALFGDDGPFKKGSCVYPNRCQMYGSECVKHPFESIRPNYDDDNDQKAINVQRWQRDGGGRLNLYLVAETRIAGQVAQKLPAFKWSDRSNFHTQLTDLINTIKLIQNFGNKKTLQSKCEDNPGKFSTVAH